MIEVNDAIARMRRDLTLGSVLKGLMLGAAMLCLLLDAVARPAGFSGSLALAVIGGVWLTLLYRSSKASQMAAVSRALIAQGALEQAERHIVGAVRSFSVFSPGRL